jgi:hypothetical protein
MITRLNIIFALMLWGFQIFAFSGAVSSSTANTGSATVETSEAAFMNPASIGHLRGYHFYTGFSTTRQTNTSKDQNLAFSLTDAMPGTVVPTALGYVQSNRQLQNEQDDSLSRNIRLSFGNMFLKRWAFGLTGSYYNDRWQNQSYQQTNLETGFLWTPNTQFGFGLQLKNLLNSDSAVPLEVRQIPQSILGFSYNYKKFVRAKVDLKADSDNSLRYTTLGFGLESYLNRWLIIRWGVGRDNEAEADQYSAGVGFAGPKFGLHYAYQSSPQNDRLTRHSVDLAVPIW